MTLKGFTLLELILTLAIATILILFATQNLSAFIYKNEKECLIQEIEKIVQYAKMQALSSESQLILSPLTRWSQGMVLRQLNPQTHALDIVHQWQWTHPHWQVEWQGAHSSKEIIFSNNLHQAMINGQFILINTQTHTQTTLILNKLGRIRIANVERRSSLT